MDNLHTKSLDELRSLFAENIHSEENQALIKKEMGLRAIRRIEAEAAFDAIVSKSNKPKKEEEDCSTPKGKKAKPKDDEEDEKSDDEDEEEFEKPKKGKTKSLAAQVETKAVSMDRTPDFIPSIQDVSIMSDVEQKSIQHYDIVHKNLVSCYKNGNDMRPMKKFEEKDSGNVRENIKIHSEVLNSVVTNKQATVREKMLSDKIYCDEYSVSKSKEALKEYNASSGAMVKSMYNTMVGTDGGSLVNTSSQLLVGKKWFIDSTSINFARIVPMVTNELKIINFASRPTVSTVFQGQNTGGVMSNGRTEEIVLKAGATYQSMFQISDQLAKEGGAAIVSQLANECMAELARKLSFEVVAGEGGGDNKIQGYLTLPTVDVTSLSFQAQQQTKVPGTNKIVSNGSSTLNPEKLQYLKYSVPQAYVARGKGAFIMHPQTYVYLMLSKDNIGNYKFGRDSFMRYGNEMTNIPYGRDTLQQVNLSNPFGNAQIGLGNSVMEVPSIWGTPVILDQYMPYVNSEGQGAGQIVVGYGNFEEYYTIGVSAAAGFRAGIAVSSDQGSTGAVAGLEFYTPFQAYVQACGQPINTQAMAFLAM